VVLDHVVTPSAMDWIPNTINPMLDAWWKTLSARLDSGPADLHRLPETVAHIAEVRPTIIVFDDVLTGGKDFRVASDLLNAEYPQARILGLFLARRYFSAQSIGFSNVDETP
jgi:hypothetical protein